MPEVNRIKEQLIYSEPGDKKLCAVTPLEEMENNISDSTKSTLESDDEEKKSNKLQNFDESITEGYISNEKEPFPVPPSTKSNDVISEQTPQNSNDLPKNRGFKQHEFENYGKRGSDPQSGSDKEWNVFKGKKPVSERLQEEWRLPKEIEKNSQPGTSTAESDKFNHDPLLSSPCPLKITLQSPQLLPPDTLESVEIDQFEDSVPTPSLQSNDNKLHAKKAVKKERVVSAIVPMPGSHGPKIDPNRVNELDRFCNLNTKTFMNNYLRPQNEFKKNPFRDLSMAGTSSSWKKIKRTKDKEKTVAQKKVPEKFTALDDAKSITNCIIKNSLNIIDVEDEIIEHHSELIQNLVDSIVKPDIQDALCLISAVGNVDLGNNSNENEGNRLAANDIQREDVVDENDDLNDNQVELEPLLSDINDLSSNNSTEVDSHIDEQQEQGSVAEPVVDNDTSVNEAETDSVAQASRDVLYDVNSEQDLLEDFDIPPQASQDNSFDAFGFGHSVLLVGVHPINSSSTRREDPPPAGAVQSIQTNPSSFPNWLLQILGSQVVPEEGTQVVLGSHDEPHFYCQGDGLGVHPSVIAVEVDEADDADNDTTTTEESSSNNTADYAEVDPGPSDMFDMSSLPEESPATSVTEENTLTDTAVLPERAQNEDAIETSSSAISDGNSIVNEVIKTAEEEVNRILELEVESQENQHSPSSSADEQPILPKLIQSHNIDESESEIRSGTEELSALSSGSSTTAEYDSCADSSGLSEQEVNGNSQSILEVSHENQVYPENGQQHMICSLARPNSIHEVKSSSASEKSEYFDL